MVRGKCNYEVLKVLGEDVLSVERSLQEDLEMERDTTFWTVIALCAVKAMPDDVSWG